MWGRVWGLGLGLGWGGVWFVWVLVLVTSSVTMLDWATMFVTCLFLTIVMTRVFRMVRWLSSVFIGTVAGMCGALACTTLVVASWRWCRGVVSSVVTMLFRRTIFRSWLVGLVIGRSPTVPLLNSLETLRMPVLGLIVTSGCATMLL